MSVHQEVLVLARDVLIQDAPIGISPSLIIPVPQSMANKGPGSLFGLKDPRIAMPGLVQCLHILTCWLSMALSSAISFACEGRWGGESELSDCQNGHAGQVRIKPLQSASGVA